MSAGGRARGCGKIKARTECVFLVFAPRAKTKASIVFAYASIDAVPKTLIELHRNRVCTADIQIHEEAAVYVVGHGLEEIHEDAGEREAAVFRGDRQGGDVAMKVMLRTLSLA